MSPARPRRSPPAAVPGLQPGRVHNKVMFPSKTRNLFQNKTRNLSLLSTDTVSAKRELLPSQLAVCRHKTVTPNPAILLVQLFSFKIPQINISQPSATCILNIALPTRDGCNKF